MTSNELKSMSTAEVELKILSTAGVVGIKFLFHLCGDLMMMSMTKIYTHQATSIIEEK